MSTRSSLVVYAWDEPYEIHIYREMLDNKYYLETLGGKVELPKEIAIRFAKILYSKSSAGEE